MQRNSFAFTLIEILVGITIVSLIIVSAFQALSAVGIWKVKLIEQTEIEKQAYYAGEKFFEMIKKWGTLDYEEYWNRYSYNTDYSSWHFLQASGFWNFGAWGNIGTTNYGASLYYCLSPNGGSMGTGGCLRGNNIFAWWGNPWNQLWNHQKYEQYDLQFIDYNSDGDNDLGDEDGKFLFSHGWSQYLHFAQDDDDLFLWEWPESFSWSRVGELYLINASWDERTFFRWNVRSDPNAPAGATCTGTRDMTGTWCLGTIEVLKLSGQDLWYDHLWDGWYWDGDGKVDTWMIHDDFVSSGGWPVAGSDNNNYWQSIFPDTLSVMDVKFMAYPSKSNDLAWKEENPKYHVAPYVQIQMTLSPSWKQKKKIKGILPQVKFSTTIGLTDLDFR